MLGRKSETSRREEAPGNTIARLSASPKEQQGLGSILAALDAATTEEQIIPQGLLGTTLFSAFLDGKFCTRIFGSPFLEHLLTQLLRRIKLINEDVVIGDHRWRMRQDWLKNYFGQSSTRLTTSNNNNKTSSADSSSKKILNTYSLFGPSIHHVTSESTATKTTNDSIIKTNKSFTSHSNELREQYAKASTSIFEPAKDERDIHHLKSLVNHEPNGRLSRNYGLYRAHNSHHVRNSETQTHLNINKGTKSSVVTGVATSESHSTTTILNVPNNNISTNSNNSSIKSSDSSSSNSNNSKFNNKQSEQSIFIKSQLNPRYPEGAKVFSKQFPQGILNFNEPPVIPPPPPGKPDFPKDYTFVPHIPENLAPSVETPTQPSSWYVLCWGEALCICAAPLKTKCHY